MTFLEFLQQLEDRLGYHQLPINPAARGIKEIFEGCALHHDLMTQVVRAVYQANRCRHLQDAVQWGATFDALGPIRLAVMRSPKTDVDTYRLVERLGMVLNEIFARQAAASERPGPATRTQTSTAKVIYLDRFRHRRFRSSA